MFGRRLFGSALALAAAIFLAAAPSAVAQPNAPDLALPQAGGGAIYAVARDGNKVYVAGTFGSIGGVTRNRLAAFDAVTGAVDAAWNPNLNNNARCLAISGGKVYVGGDFTTVNGSTTRNRVAAFNLANGSDTGTADPWNPNASANVLAMAVAGDRVYIGGNFSTVNGVTRNRLAAITLANGSAAAAVDASWNPNINSSGVWAMAIAGERVYAGGLFSTVNGSVARNNLAAFPLAGGGAAAAVDSNWNPSPNGSITALAAAGDRLYTGGSFTNVGGLARNRLAAVDLATNSNTGAADASWNPNVNDLVNAIAICGGRLVAGGSFTTVNGGTARDRAARFNLAGFTDSGTVDPAWTPGFSGGVNSILPAGSGAYFGGGFSTASGIPRIGLAGYATVGADLAVEKELVSEETGQGSILDYQVTAENFGPDPATSVVVRDVPPTQLINIVANPAPGTTYTNPDWSIPALSWPPNAADAIPQLSAGGQIHALARDANKIYVGGTFTSIGGVSRTNLAAIDANSGAVDAGWSPEPNGAVRAIAVAGGRVYVGGSFTTIAGAARNRLAALDIADGITAEAIDSAWNPNINSTVFAIAVAGKKVYIGGIFTTVNGATARSRIAALGLAGEGGAGTADAAWNPNANADVTALVVAGDRVYAGGGFTTVNGGTTRNRLAAFPLADGSNTGTANANWNPNVGGIVYGLAVAGGRVYAAGNYTTVNGSTSRNRLAAFNLSLGSDTGVADAAWNPNLNNQALSVAIVGSRLLVGGSFTTAGGASRSRGAAFNLAGGGASATVQAWNPGADGAVNAVTGFDSAAVVGGAFANAGGGAAVGLAGFGLISPSRSSLVISGTLSGFGDVINTAEVFNDGPTADPDSTPGNGVPGEDDQATVAFNLPTPTPSPSPSPSPSISPSPSLTPSPTVTQVPTPAGFTNWENPPVNPIGMSPNGQTLAVCNLADDRLEIFSLASGIPIASGVVGVGLDPTSVRFRSDAEAWVVNHISDSISVIDLATQRVVATIDTLDEPQDVVFAGSPVRAYVSCSQVDTIQVFDPVTRAQTATIAIDGEDPRALAVSPDGTKVYAAVFESGNKSTLLGGGLDASGTLAFPPNVVSTPAGPHGGVNPPPNDGAGFTPPENPSNPAPPAVGLIVKKNAAGQWMDDNNGDWTDLVSGANAAASGRVPGWDVLDNDLAIIDTATLGVTYETGMMNICMAVAVNPADGKAHVVGTDGANESRFEPVANGRFLRVNLGIAEASGAGTASIVDLNPHLDYLDSTIAQAERDKSIGDPRGIAWNAAGTIGYVTGMGSNNIIRIDAAGARLPGVPLDLGPDSGPTGIVVDSARGQLYVQNRFEGSISVIDQATFTQRARVSYFDPTPASIKIGRKHLYDTRKNSGLGQVACASCHLDSKIDRLAWDLGDPAGAMASTAGRNNMLSFSGNLDPEFHPMKGPMTTQTLQDIIGKEPLHWRGDRAGIEEFNGAFTGLQGDDTNLTTQEMQEFENFLATIFFPPNPFRTFQNGLSTSVPLTNEFASGRFALPEGTPLTSGNAQNGLALYRTGRLDDATADVPIFGVLDFRLQCVSCHTLPTGAGGNMTITGDSQITGFPPVVTVQLNYSAPLAPGPNGEANLFMTSFDGTTQDAIKVAQLRNLHDKRGFLLKPNAVSRSGFGFVHDGSVDTLSRFVTEPIFFPDATPAQGDQQVADLVAFLLSFAGSDLPAGEAGGGAGFEGRLTEAVTDFEPLGPSSKDTHAGVGKQVTVANSTVPQLVNDMIAEAEETGAGQTRGIDLVVKGRVAGVEKAWLYSRSLDVFIPDSAAEGNLALASLMALASSSSQLTFTAVPRGDGQRIAIDRDGDGFANRTEIAACSDPANPSSTPAATSQINPTSGSLAFGSQAVAGGPTAPQSINILNIGSGTLHFLGAKIVITGTDASQFAISNSPSTAPLGPSQPRLISVTFDPSSAGAKSASLTVITDSCASGVVNYPLSGTGF